MQKILAVFIGVMLAAMAAGFSPSNASAEDQKYSGGSVVMKTLLQKGIITQKEYDETLEEMKREEEGQREWEMHVDKHITHTEAGPAFADGLSIAGGITIIGQGTLGNDDNAPGEDVIDGSISADLEISKLTGANGEVFLALEAGEGDGLEGDEIVSFWGVNADAGADSTFDLTEAWYEHRFLSDTVTFTIGKLDLTNYFDGNEAANDETTQFLSGGFVNNIAVEFPENSAAARLTVSPNELIDISIGAQSGDSDWEDIFEKPFLAAEAGIKPKFRDLQGNYRIYAWTNRTDHVELKDTSNDREKGSGIGVSLDQQANDFLTFFGRIGYQDSKIYEIDIAWSGGLALNGSLWGRQNDTFAVAYGQAILSDDNEDVLRDAGINPGDEGHFEAYYSLAVNEHVAISADIQAVTNAGGDDEFETVIISGLRGQITF